MKINSFYIISLFFLAFSDNVFSMEKSIVNAQSDVMTTVCNLCGSEVSGDNLVRFKFSLFGHIKSRHNHQFAYPSIEHNSQNSTNTIRCNHGHCRLSTTSKLMSQEELKSKYLLHYVFIHYDLKKIPYEIGLEDISEFIMKNRELIDSASKHNYLGITEQDIVEWCEKNK